MLDDPWPACGRLRFATHRRRRATTSTVFLHSCRFLCYPPLDKNETALQAISPCLRMIFFLITQGCQPALRLYTPAVSFVLFLVEAGFSRFFIHQTPRVRARATQPMDRVAQRRRPCAAASIVGLLRDQNGACVHTQDMHHCAAGSPAVCHPRRVPRRVPPRAHRAGAVIVFLPLLLASSTHTAHGHRPRRGLPPPLPARHRRRRPCTAGAGGPPARPPRPPRPPPQRRAASRHGAARAARGAPASPRPPPAAAGGTGTGTGTGRGSTPLHEVPWRAVARAVVGGGGGGGRGGGWRRRRVGKRDGAPPAACPTLPIAPRAAGAVVRRAPRGLSVGVCTIVGGSACEWDCRGPLRKAVG